MRLWHSTFVFDYPWEQVVQAAYRKYPNPHNPNVVATDVVERKVNCGSITTKRILATEWNLPYLVAKIIGDCGLVYVNEQSWISRRKKVLTLRTQNIEIVQELEDCSIISFTPRKEISLANLITVDEKLTYSTNPANPNTTLLEQSAIIKVMGIPFLQGTLEDMTVRSFDSNSANGRRAIIDIIEEINKGKT